jgi:hypothetical protein
MSGAWNPGDPKKYLKSLSIPKLAYVVFLIAAALALFVTWGFVTFQNQFAEMVKQDPLRFIDFNKYYTCGLMTLSGDRAYIYDPAVQQRWLEFLLLPVVAAEVTPLPFPPNLFVGMVPWTLFERAPSWAIWGFGSLLSALVAPLIVARKNDKLPALLCGLGVLASAPFWRCFVLGQLTAFVLLLVCVYFWAFREKRDVIAGMALAMLTVKPQYAVFLATPAIALRRWRLLGIALTVCFFEVISALIIFGFNVFGDYGRLLYRLQTDPAATWTAAEMINMRGLLAHLLPLPLVGPIASAFMALTIVIIVVLMFHNLRRGDRYAEWAMSLSVCAALFANPHTNFYDAILLAAPFALTVSSNAKNASATAQAWRWILLLYPLISWFIIFSPLGTGDQKMMEFALVNLLLLLLSGRMVIQVNQHSHQRV